MWADVRVLTRHSGRDSSRASLLTPPLSSRVVHRAFSQALWPPAWGIQNPWLSSFSLASELSSALTAATWSGITVGSNLRGFRFPDYATHLPIHYPPDPGSDWVDRDDTCAQVKIHIHAYIYITQVWEWSATRMYMLYTWKHHPPSS